MFPDTVIPAAHSPAVCVVRRLKVAVAPLTVPLKVMPALAHKPPVKVFNPVKVCVPVSPAMVVVKLGRVTVFVVAVAENCRIWDAEPESTEMFGVPKEVFGVNDIV